MANKLKKASVTAIRDCMGTKKDESVLVISDVNKREIGLSLFETARELGHETLYLEMAPLKINGEEPSPEIADMMKRYSVVLIPTTTSLTHTKARRDASALGVRVATFPNITKDIMIRGLTADYHKITALCRKVKEKLETGSHIRITTKPGTDISFSIAGRKIYESKGLFHAKGESGNLPTGETYLAPVEGTANGTFVVDGSMASLGKITDTPLVFQVKNGVAESITGGKFAVKLNKMLDGVGPLARNIAEFGIGTNEKVKISGIVLEDEKVLGTVHIAVGNNKSMGGEIDVPIHLDGVIRKPDVYLDGELIMKKGKMLF